MVHIGMPIAGARQGGNRKFETPYLYGDMLPVLIWKCWDGGGCVRIALYCIVVYRLWQTVECGSALGSRCFRFVC